MHPSNKVVVRISGGLGNQLFRHAAAFALAERTGRSLYYDLSDFLIFHGRKYQMNEFAGPSKIPIWSFSSRMAYQIAYFCYKKVSPELFPLMLRFLNVLRFNEESPWKLDMACFDPALVKTPRVLYLDGNCQHIDYLPDESIVRREFAFVNPPRDRNRAWLSQFQGIPSVSVHVRRTDYLSSGTDAVLSPDYYRRAADQIRACVSRPFWVIFSDDVMWCRNHLAFLEGAVFVDGNQYEPWEDLRLMTVCQHHIIANSTFSWWGAYLGHDSAGLTVAPENWFQNLRTATCLLKEGWQTVPSFSS
jgi:hypothetical protein